MSPVLTRTARSKRRGRWRDGVDFAGDVDGDGLADIVTSGYGDDDGGEDAGAAWLVLGSTIAGLTR